eukprot:TRINITY_DN5648_c0_g2_i1.p1 TRINITY_DN5648_c0_g2~~TRINITY_DN5648_c0_g2_i1.p1  ORF type:complete len:541 (-),score=144.46 TRINITY_DN5648_c0_g2_i1:1144-2706(-)
MCIRDRYMGVISTRFLFNCLSMSAEERNQLAESVHLDERRSTLGQTMNTEGSFNFQYIEGKRNQCYVSPTFASSVFGGDLQYYRHLADSHSSRSRSEAKKGYLLDTTPKVTQRKLDFEGEQGRAAGLASPGLEQPSAKGISFMPAPRVQKQPAATPFETPARAASQRMASSSSRLFVGPDYSPPKEQRPQPPRSVSPGEVVCMVCVNEDLQAAKRATETERAAWERRLDDEQIKMIQAREAEERLQARRKREELHQEQVRQMQLELQRRAEARARKEEEAERRRLEDAQAEFQRAAASSRLSKIHEVSQYRAELEVQREQQRQRRLQERSRELEEGRRSVGLSLGSYHPADRRALARELETQMTEKKSRRDRERLEETMYAQSIHADVERHRDAEVRRRDEMEKNKKGFMERMAKDLQGLKERRAEERRRLAELKQEERTAAEEFGKRQLEFERRRKMDIAAELSRSYERQMTEKKIRETSQRKEEVPSPPPPASTSCGCQHVNCSRCNRRIPLSGAFRI